MDQVAHWLQLERLISVVIAVKIDFQAEPHIGSITF